MNHQIYLSHGCAVLKSVSLHTDVHAHLAHQWTFSLDAKPFSLWLDEHWQQATEIFIPSQRPHQFAEQSGLFLTVLIDADCTVQYQTQLQHLLQRHIAGGSSSDLSGFLQALTALRQISDDRIRQVLALIETAQTESDCSANSLAGKVALDRCAVAEVSALAKIAAGISRIGSAKSAGFYRAGATGRFL